MTIPSDTDLIARFKNEDNAAFTRIYNRYWNGIIFFALRFVTEEDARDITADTFVKLLHRRAKFNSLPEIQQWLRITTQNACIDLLRKSRSATEHEKRILYLADKEYEQSFFQDMLRADLYARIEQVMQELPAQARQVFDLSYLQGLTNKEIADRLHISDKTVRNQKAISLKLLRKRFTSTDMLIIYLINFHLFQLLTDK